jgi:hypothetical protein
MIMPGLLILLFFSNQAVLRKWLRTSDLDILFEGYDQIESNSDPTAKDDNHIDRASTRYFLQTEPHRPFHLSKKLGWSVIPTVL